MLIAGYQPLSLIDYPGVICSVIFTQGCPFRCAYCHNPELIPAKPLDTTRMLSEQTVLESIKKRANFLEGVCITGGEPTMQADLIEFIKKIRALGLRVKLDTNGVHPRLIEQTIKEKLVDFFAMDIKHTWKHYGDIIGLRQQNVINNCRKTFDLIQASNISHEFRTTVYSTIHNADDLKAIARQLHAGESYALQDLRYEKTLVSNLAQSARIDLEAVAASIREDQPGLHISVRA